MPSPIKKGLFRVCVRSGRIVGFHSKWLRWAFPFVGLIALVWHLVRVIPKPSRIDYPCQRVAGPLGWGFVGYLASLPAAVLAFRTARGFFRKACYGLAVFFAVVAAIAAMVHLHTTSPQVLAAATVTPNVPVGIARGIYPGRVVWARDPNATPFPGGTSVHWWQPTQTDQTKVDYMVSNALHGLTNATSDAVAWDALFRNFNIRRGIGNISYQQSARKQIAIKINQNPTNSDDLPGGYYTDNGVSSATFSPGMITGNPHILLSLVKQLTAFGVQQSDIVIYDASGITGSALPGYPRTIGDNIYTYIHSLYPNVRFADGCGQQGRELVAASGSNCINYTRTGLTGSRDQCGLQIAQQVLDAGFLINLAIMKNHSVVQTGIGNGGPTLCFKNQYGSILSQRHGPIWGYEGTPAYYSNMIEPMGHHELGDKTLLFMIDALYGCKSQSSAPSKWANSPFNGSWPASIFLSQDPVAIDSVGFDFMNAEWGLAQNSDYYLQEAASIPDSNGRKLSGTVYTPTVGSSAVVGSLGVFEHWNNSRDRKYSRNLNPVNGVGIELIRRPSCFIMDGLPDSDAYKLGSSGSDSSAGALYAAIQGSTLYVAAPILSGSTDTFIFISNSTGSVFATPSSKAGSIAFNPSKDPYLKVSGTSSSPAWTNGGTSAKSYTDKTVGDYLEGTIDLVQVFGSVPKTLYIAFAPYNAGSGGTLIATQQIPQGNGDINVDASEVLAVPTASIRDDALIGTPAALDSQRSFIATPTPGMNGFIVTWPTLPGHSYQLLYSDDLIQPFVALSTPITATSQQFQVSFQDATSIGHKARFYRVQHLGPE